jgi:hypothetical protein
VGRSQRPKSQNVPLSTVNAPAALRPNAPSFQPSSAGATSSFRPNTPPSFQPSSSNPSTSSISFPPVRTSNFNRTFTAQEEEQRSANFLSKYKAPLFVKDKNDHEFAIDRCDSSRKCNAYIEDWSQEPTRPYVTSSQLRPSQALSEESESGEYFDAVFK